MLDINELVECLENMIDEFTYYYDKKKCEIVEINMKYIALADKYLSSDSLLDYSDWEKEAIFETVNFINNYDRYIALPDRFEVDEYRLMARFCCTCYAGKKKKYVKKLTDALTGKSPVMRFNEVITSLKLASDWREFKYNELMNVAVSWCNKNGVSYE